MSQLVYVETFERADADAFICADCNTYPEEDFRKLDAHKDHRFILVRLEVV
jgi:hypothetical protein